MSYCEYCKCKVNDDEKVCSQCGAPVKHDEKNKTTNYSAFVRMHSTTNKSNVTSTVQKKTATPKQSRALTFIIVIIIISFAMVSLISSQQNSSSKTTNSSSNNFSDKKPERSDHEVNTFFEESGYVGRYKINSDGSSIFIYQNEKEATFYGLFETNSDSFSDTYVAVYFYGNIEDFSTSYIFDIKDSAENNYTDEKENCSFDMNANADSYLNYNTDKVSRDNLKSKLTNWLSDENIKRRQIRSTLHLSKGNEKRSINLITSALDENGYQTQITNDSTVVVTSPHGTTFTMLLDPYGATKRILYSNTEKNINKQYIYSRNKKSEVNKEAVAVAKEDDFLWICSSGYKYGSYYYFMHHE
ncbi:hypothetical protein [Breznakia pachnodae]|uniref:Zinc ribbon domain-containing protein n=1 Tax=Breznakia pachnodae TaxID=265178 RepID=A0ABU0E5R0_9FIRM|nr:hypothetical protein [Breznakia pachnodae]MDQ0362232.1 hypothetical protein [Breznakia pachnodae]